MAEHLVSCPLCGHPTRKHDDDGCTMGNSSEACFCILSSAEINPPEPQHVDLVDVELQDSTAEALAAVVEAGLTFRLDQTVGLVDDVEDAQAAETEPVAPAVDEAPVQEPVAIPAGYVEAPAITGLLNHVGIAGWSGVPGQCGVECACGFVFDNFATLAEAAALLDGHIAAANSPTSSPAPEPSVSDVPPARPARPSKPRKARLAAPQRTRLGRPGAAPAVPVTPPADSPVNHPLMWWDAWHCERCFSRYFTPRLCCDIEAIPVRVTVTHRAGGAR